MNKVSEPRLGIPARLSFNHPYGRDMEPRRVEHLQFGITWDVTEILDRWEHHRPPEETLGKPSSSNGGCCASAGRCPAVPPSAASS